MARTGMQQVLARRTAKGPGLSRAKLLDILEEKRKRATSSEEDPKDQEETSSFP